MREASGKRASSYRVTSGDLSWSVPPPLEDDFGMSLADRDARLLHQQQREAGQLLADCQAQAHSLGEEKQYLANAVARLAFVKPDVVLVEGDVARMAQEDLLSRNISVAQKVKASVLDRLARCMGVRVTPTVEHLSPTSAHLYLGDCK
ncbi:1-phosphatidylinositol 3-phosphate 5-kinase, partial [Tetrabaena socialis]